jgi:hypothetical protein
MTLFERNVEAEWRTKLWGAVANVAIIIGVVVVMTFLVLLLYFFRCYKVVLNLSCCQ